MKTDSADFLYRRADFRRPSVQLLHSDIFLSFYEDRVEGVSRMTFTAREPVREIVLDAKELEILSAAADPSGGAFVYDRAARKLTMPLAAPLAVGDRVTVSCRVVSRPDDVHLEGLYRDVTPTGCPQQYMSQCQQFGFQRILPVVDDCTAKGTFRTLLEGDARYTHLISNGDCLNPSGGPDLEALPEYRDLLALLKIEPAAASGRRRMLYRNDRPMAPYLFLACAGTWETCADEVVYPDTKQRIRLEYLVPPGRADGARIPMRILKESILFQHEELGYSYPYEVYRTICMEKSLYGGMENTGNTTIITEAALIDASTADRRLIYAHGVIPHEYEHNHCGSGVTMESVFDMWLNEGFTVNVERAYLHRTFGATFMRRLEIEEMCASGGPFAQEEAGTAGCVVREGVNDPDEVVDAVTYVKAPEVLNTLKNLIGPTAYRAATDLYFDRYSGGNANTDQFLACFDEVTGRDISGLMRPWLFTHGFPTVTATSAWENGRLRLRLSQDKNFPVPVSWAAVKDGKDIASGHLTLNGPEQTMTGTCPVSPDFISWNRGCGFYGVLVTPDVTEDVLARQVCTDPDELNRIAAFRVLQDRVRARASVSCEQRWLELYRTVFFDETLPDGLKTRLLVIPDDPDDRSLRTAVRENVKETHRLRRAAAACVGPDALTAALAACEKAAAENNGESLPIRILRRERMNTLLTLLAELRCDSAQEVLRRHLPLADNITDRLNTLRALLASGASDRLECLAAAGETLRGSLNGYIGWLGIVASDPEETVFDALAREEARPGWSITHPGLSRALYCGMAANREQLFTPRGLAWLEETFIKYARVSEYNALRLLEPIENYRAFDPDLSAACRVLLERAARALPRDRYPFVGSRLAALL